MILTQPYYLGLFRRPASKKGKVEEAQAHLDRAETLTPFDLMARYESPILKTSSQEDQAAKQYKFRHPDDGAKECEIAASPLSGKSAMEVIFCGNALERDSIHLAGSVTSSTRSTATFFSVCTTPDGQ
jgi:hypothetical protein